MKTDLYGAFATAAALDNYISKSTPDIERTTTTTTSSSFITNSFTSVKEKLFSSSAPPAGAEQESVVPAFILSRVADRADYTKAIMSLAASGVFMLLAFFVLPTIFFAPQKFTMLFTLSLIAFIGGLAYL